jgi:hypothetical protein
MERYLLEFDKRKRNGASLMISIKEFKAASGSNSMKPKFCRAVAMLQECIMAASAKMEKA